MLARLRLWAAGSPAGFATVTTVCALGGFSVVLTQLWLTGVLSRLGDATAQIVSITLCYLAFATVTGIAATMWVQRRNLGWLSRKEAPTPIDGRRVLRQASRDPGREWRKVLPRARFREPRSTR